MKWWIEFLFTMFLIGTCGSLLFGSNRWGKWQFIMIWSFLRLINFSIDRFMTTMIFIIVLMIIMLINWHSLLIILGASVLWPTIYLTLCHKLTILCLSRLRLNRRSLHPKSFTTHPHFKLTRLSWKILFYQIHLLLRDYFAIIIHIIFYVLVTINLVILLTLTILNTTCSLWLVRSNITVSDFWIYSRNFQNVSFLECICTFDIAIRHVRRLNKCLNFSFTYMTLKWIVSDNPFVYWYWNLLNILFLSTLTRRNVVICYLIFATFLLKCVKTCCLGCPCRGYCIDSTFQSCFVSSRTILDVISELAIINCNL